jgi:hypothetical protein
MAKPSGVLLLILIYGSINPVSLIASPGGFDATVP